MDPVETDPVEQTPELTQYYLPTQQNQGVALNETVEQTLKRSKLLTDGIKAQEALRKSGYYNRGQTTQNVYGGAPWGGRWGGNWGGQQRWGGYPGVWGGNRWMAPQQQVPVEQQQFQVQEREEPRTVTKPVQQPNPYLNTAMLLRRSRQGTYGNWGYGAGLGYGQGLGYGGYPWGGRWGGAWGANRWAGLGHVQHQHQQQQEGQQGQEEHHQHQQHHHLPGQVHQHHQHQQHHLTGQHMHPWGGMGLQNQWQLRNSRLGLYGMGQYGLGGWNAQAPVHAPTTTGLHEVQQPVTTNQNQQQVNMLVQETLRRSRVNQEALRRSRLAAMGYGQYSQYAGLYNGTMPQNAPHQGWWGQQPQLVRTENAQ